MHRRKTWKWLVLIGIILLVAACGEDSGGLTDGDTPDGDAPDGDTPDGDDEPPLHALPRDLELTHWKLAPSTEAGAEGAALSTAGFDDSGWIDALVPGTVMGAQTEAGLLGDPLYGENLRKLPGYALSFLPMPHDSPYRDSWWWRVEFDTPQIEEPNHSWLVFEGINYSANIWLNGQPVASREEVIGTFREFRFDVSGLLIEGGRNALAVEVFAPDLFQDLAIFWVDWNPTPPDRNMGLWMPARLETRGEIALLNPAVQTALQADGSAELTLIVELENAAAHSQPLLLSGELDGEPFALALEVGPGGPHRFRLTSADIPLLHMATPKLWWPHHYGEPHLYPLSLEVWQAERRSDAIRFDFGVREVRGAVNADNAMLYEINGKPILIRGAGWAPDIFYRHDPERDLAEVLYVKDMGLNTIRLEGKFEPRSFYELCDRHGILLMPGWCCCDVWEQWDVWTDESREVARASLENQLRRLRRHPSVFTWLNGSDFHPPPDVERMYLELAEAADWDLPIVSNATETPSEVTGPSGMKMTGPYNWVPPVYWYIAVPDDPGELSDRIDWEWMYGGAYGFNSESSPGPAIPPLDSLLRMMPVKDLWPVGSVFLFHSGGVSTSVMRLSIYQDALNDRLGEPTGLEDFAFKSQIMSYEAHRAMFEAQGRNKYYATGFIQWMLNNAWPGMIWQLYDYFLRPAGSYFGSKAALRPLHVQYSYDDHSVWVVNSTLNAYSGLRVKAGLYGLDSLPVAAREATLDSLRPDGNEAVLSLDALIQSETTALSPVFFLDLRLYTEEGEEIDRNFYWLSTQGDELDWDDPQADPPRASVAPMTALAELPLVELNVSELDIREEGESTTLSVTLENRSEHLAFFVELLLREQGEGLPVLPVLWDDNYISLLPGETRTLHARVSSALLFGIPELQVTGWNVAGR